MKGFKTLAVVLLSLGVSAAHASTLDIAIVADPQPLDPALSGASFDRNVFASLCDKLIDTDNDLHPVPQLATSWDWASDGLSLTLHLRAGVKFQDNTDFDAEAVKINLDRLKTMPTSLRKAELRPVSAIDVVDPMTVRLRLSVPYAPLIAVLSDRSGMMLSPKNIRELGDKVSSHPVCAGPFSFTQRIAQDRIVLDRFPGYWNASSIFIDRVVFRPMPDSSIRLANLQAGQIQIIDQMLASDVEATKGSAVMKVAQHSSAAFRYLGFNTNNGPRSAAPFGRDARVRRAFGLALDRKVINDVAYNGTFTPNSQTELPGSFYWDPDYPVPPQDIEGAKALLKQAGVDRVAMTLQLSQAPLDTQIGEIIQAMVREAGFDIKLLQMESNAGNKAIDAGEFDIGLLGWSGRADPDANISILIACDGPFNHGKYCNPEFDATLKEGRETVDPDKRKALYRKAVQQYEMDAPILVLCNMTYLWGLSARVEGFVPNADGLIRLQNVRLKN